LGYSTIRFRATDSSFGEDVSRIQSRLVIETDVRGLRVVSLFGLTRGAGSTTVAASVAAGLASQSLRVVLVDANVASPSVHRLFGIEPSPGVAETLESATPPAQAVRSASIANLDVMPAGTWSNALGASLPERWKKLFAPLRNAYRLVIVDAGSADSAHVDGIARGSDAVALVVECGRSRWEQIASFAAHMDEIGVPCLGVVLNKRRRFVPRFLDRGA
jgi:Mrp family chromosome partitioning ATPase